MFRKCWFLVVEVCWIDNWDFCFESVSLFGFVSVLGEGVFLMGVWLEVS